MLPIIEDDRQRGERCAEFMRRTRRHQADADDMIFFRRLLAQVGQMQVACAQVPVDPRDEKDQQRGGEHEADEAALDMQGCRSRRRRNPAIPSSWCEAVSQTKHMLVTPTRNHVDHASNRTAASVTCRR